MQLEHKVARPEGVPGPGDPGTLCILPCELFRVGMKASGDRNVGISVHRASTHEDLICSSQEPTRGESSEYYSCGTGLMAERETLQETHMGIPGLHFPALSTLVPAETSQMCGTVKD